MIYREKVLEVLKNLKIEFQIFEHPSIPTIESALEYLKNIEARHCKNLFFRNHKGNRHYLIILDYKRSLSIYDLEKRLKQGKISIASDQRIEKYLGLKAGSVSSFGLINYESHHVHLLIDETLRSSGYISFHPDENTFTIVIRFNDFEKFLIWTGNCHEILKLYN